MKVAFRAVAVSVLLALAWAGPLAPLAAAQQPTTPPAQPEPAPAQPEQMPPPPGRSIDVWDVGAVALTAFGLPLKGVICGLGISMSAAVFFASWAARPDAVAGITDEACGSKAHWIVRGSDIRPQSSATKAFEWETHRYQWER